MESLRKDPDAWRIEFSANTLRRPIPAFDLAEMNCKMDTNVPDDMEMGARG